MREAKINSDRITHATSNFGIRNNLHLVLHLEDLANSDNGLNLFSNCLYREKVSGQATRQNEQQTNTKFNEGFIIRNNVFT